MIIYGIKNCDSVKKSLKYFDAKNSQYQFIDLKKEKIDSKILKDAIDQLGADKIINKKSTTYRNLDSEIKKDIEKDVNLIFIITNNPTLIKRPLIFYKEIYYCGFDNEKFDIITSS